VLVAKCEVKKGKSLSSLDVILLNDLVKEKDFTLSQESVCIARRDNTSERVEYFFSPEVNTLPFAEAVVSVKTISLTFRLLAALLSLCQVINMPEPITKGRITEERMNLYLLR
jgi:hypothetical protein